MARRAWASVCDTRNQSHAECLLRIGRLAFFFVRHGASISDAAAALGLGQKVCLLALAFYTSLDGFKFRALVEDWPMLTILRRLRDPNCYPRATELTEAMKLVRQSVQEELIVRCDAGDKAHIKMHVSSQI